MSLSARAQAAHLVAGSGPGPRLEVALADAAGHPASVVDGPHDHWRMATASTPPPPRWSGAPIRIWRLRCSSTSASTGSIEVATRTTARTVWSVPWQPWQRSWLAIG